jgi:hypothetical protein
MSGTANLSMNNMESSSTMFSPGASRKTCAAELLLQLIVMNDHDHAIYLASRRASAIVDQQLIR